MAGGQSAASELQHRDFPPVSPLARYPRCPGGLVHTWYNWTEALCRTELSALTRQGQQGLTRKGTHSHQDPAWDWASVQQSWGKVPWKEGSLPFCLFPGAAWLWTLRRQGSIFQVPPVSGERMLRLSVRESGVKPGEDKLSGCGRESTQARGSGLVCAHLPWWL